MWILNWWRRGADEGGGGVITPPVGYADFEYRGDDTFLTLLTSAGAQYIALRAFETVSLPADLPWTIRALADGRLVGA